MNQKGLANAHKEVAVTLNIASKTLDIDQNKPSLYNELNYFNSDIETIRDIRKRLDHIQKCNFKNLQLCYITKITYHYEKIESF